MSEKVADAKVKLSLEDKLTAPLKHLQKKFDTLSKTLSHRLSIPRFSAAVKNMTTSLHGVQSALGTAANRASVFTGALGLAGGGLVASLTAVTMKTMHMGDSLYHASRHLGMSVTSLQLWGDAADNSGYSAELFQQSLATLNRRSAQAYAGQKRGIMGFEALGISVKNASGKLKSNSVLLEEITDKMSKMKNQAQRQHIAALLFGGDGKEMAAMLAQGMEPIKELFAKAQKGKWLIGADVARYAADLSDKLGAFKKKIGGIASFIGARFMPVINDMIDGFSKLIDENRDLIQTTVAGWARSVKKVFNDLLNPTSDLRKSISDLTERIKGWFRWLEPLIGEITVFKVGLVAVGSFIFGPLIAALAAAGAAFVTLGYAIMTTPIGWILGGITALVATGYLLYKNWDTVISFISKLLDSFASLCSNVFDQLFTLFKNFSPLTWIAKEINELIKWLLGVDLMEAGANLINGLWEGIKRKWDDLYNEFGNMMNGLTSWMPNWMKEKLGFNVSINKTSTQTIKTFTDETNARAKRMLDTAMVPYSPSGRSKSSSNTGVVETGQMQAKTVKVESFKVPEPITVHKPVEIDARVMISNLNISVPNGLKDEIRAAVNQALEHYAKQQRFAIASSLSD
ncbi:phage tail tape measure protein [Bartonella bilalgolemii]|uniref:Phage tail tape measure protein n=1 Tax=Bartonella bilalgolemii TaxID=2942911 RepID=A0ABT0P9R5_9HYPH|nr:phage tail tape measure protein [Bartonella sp. G70]MCL6230200.1 phage tail tape measure protein [Bartonella sp. G70]